MKREEGSSSNRSLQGGVTFWAPERSLFELLSVEVGEALLEKLWDWSQSAERAEYDGGVGRVFAVAIGAWWDLFDADFLGGGPLAMKDLSSLRISANRGTVGTSGASREAAADSEGTGTSAGVSSAWRFLLRFGPHWRLRMSATTWSSSFGLRRDGV